MGGEKEVTIALTGNAPGSPPHGRGKALLTECRHFVVGITPAWAGKSSFAPVGRLSSQDHPRMGGEKTKKIP